LGKRAFKEKRERPISVVVDKKTVSHWAKKRENRERGKPQNQLKSGKSQQRQKQPKKKTAKRGPSGKRKSSKEKKKL